MYTIYKKALIFLLLLSIIVLLKPVSAFEIASDPQYVVINFADFYKLDWNASEEKWQKEVKPRIKQQLRLFKTQLTIGNPTRKLAWSTLLEYTNFPMDAASPNAVYVQKARRIMEVAEEEKLPVFIPLNGVQWWNEIPELWNYWDPDGNHTPGCENDNFMKIDGYVNNQPIYRCKFERLRDPQYREKFIKGYNPDNKWNVDWADWETPMKFNTRNWGGGDIDVAPPANIVDHGRTALSFKKLQTQRFEAILNAVSKKLSEWESTGKQDLFAGITIGTEVTLNASIKPGDENFKPFGFRALEDTFCPKDQPMCGKEATWSATQLTHMREEVLNTYFNDMAQRAVAKGLPKQRIYSHVWSEADKGELRYTDAIGSSVTLYSRPGMSIYGKALNPLGFTLLRQTLENNGYPGWAAPEFAPLTRDAANWNTSLSRTLDTTLAPAKIIDVYNERDIIGTAAIPQIKATLSEEASLPKCFISETNPMTNNNQLNPSKLVWKEITASDSADLVSVVISKDVKPTQIDSSLKEVKLPKESSEYMIPSDLPDGKYYWLIKRSGCEGTHWTTSTPYFFVKKYIPPSSLTFWQKVKKFLGLK